MKRYFKATLAVIGFCFIAAFGFALLPFAVAVLGTLAGIVAVFAPLIVIWIVIAIIANTVYKEKK